MPFNNGQLPSFKSLLGSLIDELNKTLIVIDIILIIVSL